MSVIVPNLQGKFLPQGSSKSNKVIVFSIDLDDTIMQEKQGHRVYDDKALKLMAESLQKLANATNTPILPIIVSNASMGHVHRALHHNRNLENIFFHKNNQSNPKLHNPIFARDNIVRHRLIAKQSKHYPHYLTRSLQKRKMISDIHDIAGWVHIGDDEHFSNLPNHKPDEKFLENIAEHHFKERYKISLPPYIFSKLGFISYQQPSQMVFSQSKSKDFSKDWQAFMDAIVREVQNFKE